MDNISSTVIIAHKINGLGFIYVVSENIASCRSLLARHGHAIGSIFVVGDDAFECRKLGKDFFMKIALCGGIFYTKEKILKSAKQKSGKKLFDLCFHNETIEREDDYIQ